MGFSGTKMTSAPCMHPAHTAGSELQDGFCSFPRVTVRAHQRGCQHQASSFCFLGSLAKIMTLRQQGHERSKGLSWREAAQSFKSPEGVWGGDADAPVGSEAGAGSPCPLGEGWGCDIPTCTDTATSALQLETEKRFRNLLRSLAH